MRKALLPHHGRRGLLRAAVLATVTIAASADVSAYTVVLTSGARLELKAKPQFVLGTAKVETVDGRRFVLRQQAVSESSTAIVNGGSTSTASPTPPGGRAWTNADLARLDGRPVNVVGTGTVLEEPPPAEPGVAEPQADEPTSAEADWRAQALRLADEETQMAQRLAALERLDEQWQSFALGTDGFESPAARELREIRRERAALEKDLAQVRGERRRLEESARVQRVPPGWLR